MLIILTTRKIWIKNSTTTKRPVICGVISAFHFCKMRLKVPLLNDLVFGVDSKGKILYLKKLTTVSHKCVHKLPQDLTRREQPKSARPFRLKIFVEGTLVMFLAGAFDKCPIITVAFLTVLSRPVLIVKHFSEFNIFRWTSILDDRPEMRNLYIPKISW